MLKLINLHIQENGQASSDITGPVNDKQNIYINIMN